MYKDKNMKYKISVGAFITHIAHGTFIVSADTENEAIEKAKYRFELRQRKTPRNNDIGSIQVDSIEIVED